MRTAFRSSGPELTVEAKDAKAAVLGPAGCAKITNDPALRRARPLSIAHLAPVFRAISLDVIQRQEREFTFAATSTHSAVRPDHFRTTSSAREEVTLQFGLIDRGIVTQPTTCRLMNVFQARSVFLPPICQTINVGLTCHRISRPAPLLSQSLLFTQFLSSPFRTAIGHRRSVSILAAMAHTTPRTAETHRRRVRYLERALTNGKVPEMELAEVR